MNTSVATVYLPVVLSDEVDGARRHRREVAQWAITTFEQEQEAALAVWACSDAPDGRAHWSVRHLVDEAVELGTVNRIMHTSVEQIAGKY